MLSAVAAFVPTLAPAANLLNNVYGALNSKRRRSEIEEDQFWPEVPEVNTTSHFKRAGNSLVYADILDRVQKLEKQSTKSWIDNVNSKRVTPVATFVDKAA